MKGGSGTLEGSNDVRDTAGGEEARMRVAKQLGLGSAMRFGGDGTGEGVAKTGLSACASQPVE